jgi:GNAT superfamily N-acetyltransferase
MLPHLQALARRLERAQALQNDRFTQAAGGKSLPVGGGYAHFRGPAHPLNQALGLVDPVSEAELEAVEAFLGTPTVLELSPGADQSLWALLARRGYRLQMFQQLWVRELSGLRSPDPEVEIHPVRPEEARAFNQVVAAGFSERDDWREVTPFFEVALDVSDAWGFLASVDGEAAGGGMLGVVDGVALLSGDVVLPRYRGRDIQKALIRARLAFAQERGCDLACASTLPGTPSQRHYEGTGFRAAYPKVELTRG